MEPARDERGDLRDAVGRAWRDYWAAMEPARDERGDRPGSTRDDGVHHAAMEPARDERGDPRIAQGAQQKQGPQWSPLAMSGATRVAAGHTVVEVGAAMEPARDERGDTG